MQSTSSFQRAIDPASTYESDFGDMLAIMVAARGRKDLTSEQIDLFEESLAEIVQRSFVETGGWEKAKANPNWGTQMRVLAVDYGACRELRAAYQLAGGGIDVTAFPIKTTMWISPGTVRVRNGYDGEEIELIEHSPC